MDNHSNREVPISDSEHADDYFAELCALASTGTLSSVEWHQLEVHLSRCASCRALRAEYDRVLATTLPAMASSRSGFDDGQSSNSYAFEEAEAALFERIRRENIEPDKPVSSPQVASRLRKFWPTALAAAIVFGCSYAGYRLRAHHDNPLQSAHNGGEGDASIARSVPQGLRRDLGSSPEVNDRKMASRLSELEHRLNASASKETALEGERQSLLNQLAERNSALKEQTRHDEELEQKLSFEEADSQTLRSELDQATNQRLLLIPSSDALQRQVTDLQSELGKRDHLIAKQEELLDHDGDIRNLMGARDLYIGEIYDVAKSGKTQKPFGRVFYTQGKSLVFYAYDLDQQPGVELASTFQAWGRKGIDQKHDVSLGIFYQDDQNKMRWVLKSNDSVTLSKLDAVFVTIEPHGESSKPTGKPLLFTYLRLPPNHP